MYKLLIVDDEIHSVDALKEVVDWKSMGIDKVYSAFNMNNAIEILERHAIDIMLSDIEMPLGSGLDLLEWVQANNPQTASIMLTCHAEFEYAQKAIQSGSIGYLLKPVRISELTESVRKAIHKIEKENEFVQGREIRQLWSKHHAVLVEKFWLDIINQAVPPNAKAIKELADRMNIEYEDSMQVIPLLVRVQGWEKQMTTRELKIMNYALKNASEEIIINKNKRLGRMIEVEPGVLVGLVVKAYIDACNLYFKCNLSCYIGQQVHAYQLFQMIERLNAVHDDNVSAINKVIRLDRLTKPALKLTMPDMNMWFVLLREGSRDAVLEEAVAYLEKLLNKDGVDGHFIRIFQQDFLQMLYLYLNEKGIQAHQLFSDSISIGLASKAARSLFDLIGWVKYAIYNATDYVNEVEQSNTVIKKVKQYIALNLGQDLSREKIAEYVCLNKDYLSRFFKKETGLALYDYISQERVKLAKELLTKTETPIGGIAATVGYNNFSHFSQMFKKYTGDSPGDYRAQPQK
jgi:two-component system response regulator YesN